MLSSNENSELTLAAQARIEKARQKATLMLQNGRAEADRVAAVWLGTRIAPDIEALLSAADQSEPLIVTSRTEAMCLCFGATAYEHLLVMLSAANFRVVIDELAEHVRAEFRGDLEVLTNLKEQWAKRASGREKLQNADLQVPNIFWRDLGNEFAKLDGADVRAELNDYRWWSASGGPSDQSATRSIGPLVRRALAARGFYERSVAVDVWMDALYQESSHSSGDGIDHLSVACAEYCYATANPLDDEPAQRTNSADISSAPHTAAPPVRTFRKQGEFWTISFDGKTITTKDSKGLNYIDHLLRNPRTSCLAADLVAGIGGATEIVPIGSAGLTLDPKAIAEFRSRSEYLQRELAAAERNNDSSQKEVARDEIEKLTNQLLAAKGMGGRDRQSLDDREKIRKSVSVAIGRSIEGIRGQHPALADHLARYIDRGHFLTYSCDFEWNF